MEHKEAPFAFFGTPYVARDTLAELIAAGYRPRVVITSPDARSGRGLMPTPSATREFAAAHGLSVLAPDQLDKAFREALCAFNCRYAVVVAYGKILPQDIIDAFPLGILNIHYSLLPKYRGASPVEAALLNGDSETGVTIQQMALRMDAGDILSQRSLPIEPTDTAKELRPKLISLGTQLLLETLPGFIEQSTAPTPQDESNVSYARKIVKEEGLLSLKDTGEKNWRTYRAYAESPGTHFFAEKQGQRIRIKIVHASYDHERFAVERIVPEGRSEQDFDWLARSGWSPV